MDAVRYALDDDDHAEFYWFARECPRNYRYHIYHAQHRLSSMRNAYAESREQFAKALREPDRSETFGIAFGRGLSYQLYWDFEAYLAAVSSALDILARITGLFYPAPTPPSFNRFCAKKDLTGAADILRDARSRWVTRLKDYRDCFVHYTPVDNETSIGCFRYSDGWEVRAKLPTNPNIRESDGFRFSRRSEVLRYSFTTYRHLNALDRKVGQAISRSFRDGTFPARRDNLFFVSARQRGAA
jgi:hypothetical protein